MLMMMMVVVLYQGMPCNASAGMIEWERTIQPFPPHLHILNFIFWTLLWWRKRKSGPQELPKHLSLLEISERYFFVKKGYISKICFEWLNIAMCTIYHSLPPFPLHQKLICLEVISHHIFRLLSLNISTSESAKYLLKNQRNTYQRIREIQLKESEKYI